MERAKHMVLLPKELVAKVAAWEEKDHDVIVTLADDFKFNGRVTNQMELWHNGPECESHEIKDVERKA
jgi:hypothetical protein